MREKWLITGSLGYIGSDLYQVLLKSGYEVIGLDNLSTGVRARGDNQNCVIADLRDEDFLSHFLKIEKFAGIAHLAAKKNVGESMTNPAGYWAENTMLSNRLFEIASLNGVQKFIFASTAAVYSTEAKGDEVLFAETSKLGPTSIYGQTKLATEEYILENSRMFGIAASIFRFFNVAGATEYTGWDVHGENVIPIAFRCIANDQDFQLFGNDYPTKDGTCVRDYIHVRDITSALSTAVESVSNWGKDPEIFNIGTGRGFSVLELLRQIQDLSGKSLRIVDSPRRFGDPSFTVASPLKMKLQFG
jgi:UDP-glucose 4-epimerase